MIIDEINKANVEAMKNKDAEARVVLGIVKNKYMLLGIEKRAKNEEIKDEDMVQILTKTIKELNEEAENYQKVGNTDQYNNVMYQKTFIEKYMPQMMSVDEIKAIINTLPDKSIPFVMKHFKQNYAGKCNMSDVSALARNI